MIKGHFLKPGSFQFRLLCYLLLVSAVPLFIAAIVFYNQSSAFAGSLQRQNVDRAHEQALSSLEDKLLQMKEVAERVGGDYVVQQQVVQASTDNSASTVPSLEAKSYIDNMLKREIRHNPELTAICLRKPASLLTTCVKAADSGTGSSTGSGSDNGNGSGISEEILMSSRPRQFDPIRISEGSGSTLQYAVRYMESIGDAGQLSPTGQVSIVLNLSSFMLALLREQPAVQLTVKDQLGNLVYATGNEAEASAAQRDSSSAVFVSDRKLTIGDMEWRSRYSAPSTFVDSSLHTLRNVLGIIFIGLIVAVLGSSLWFSGYAMKPVHRLRSLMKRAELGDLKAYWTSQSMLEMNELGESYNQMLNRVEELIRKVKREESLKKQAEMEALQYQLNPHFLYNTLNTIKWVAKLNKTPQISEVVTALVRLLQSSLRKDGDFLTLREEANLIRDYMEIQAFRFGDKVKVAYEIDELAQRCLVPRMILQPLVENAILHGIEPAKRDGLITIKAWTERDLLFCQVEDNGIGMPPPALSADGTKTHKMRERMSGIGLKHIREKIRLYYGPDYYMQIMEKERQGTTVRLALPVHLGDTLEKETEARESIS